MKLFFATLAFSGVSFTSGASLRQAVAQETVVVEGHPCSTRLLRCNRRIATVEQHLGQAIYDAHHGDTEAEKKVSELEEIYGNLKSFVQNIKSSTGHTRCPQDLKDQIREQCSFRLIENVSTVVETASDMSHPCGTSLLRCDRRSTQLEQLLGQALYDAHHGDKEASKRVERLREASVDLTKYIEEIKSSNVQECPRELRKEIRERCSRAALDV